MSFVQLLPEEATSALDHTLADRLGALLGERSPKVLALLALTAAAVREGHVALDTRSLPTSLQDAPLEDSPLVGQPGEDSPLILDDGCLYLHRYHQHEVRLAAALRARAAHTLPVDEARLNHALERFFPSTEGPSIEGQRSAAALSATRSLCVVTGGPGTGKTTLVTRLLATLVTLADSPLRVRMLAPTGKAAHRLGETVSAQLDLLGLTAEQRAACPTQGETIHRAMGSIRGSRVQFRHNEETPLPADIIVVDEASMVDLALMRKLVEAVPIDARLIFLGDPHQLASVQAGAVLASICNGPTPRPPHAAIQDSLAHLEHSWRFEETGGIGALAHAIQSGDVAAAQIALREAPELTWIEGDPDQDSTLSEAVRTGFQNPLTLETTRQVHDALAGMRQFKVLCAVRQGSRGVDALNARCEQILFRGRLATQQPSQYEGRPILIQKNDYAHGLFNGDQGLVRRSSGGWVACFESEDGVHEVSTARLPEHTTAFAMSIHKSQGSEYQQVAIVLPDADHQILSRELLYTAVTRARASILLYASPEALARAIETPTVRVSGLARRLWQSP